MMHTRDQMDLLQAYCVNIARFGALHCQNCPKMSRDGRDGDNIFTPPTEKGENSFFRIFNELH